MKVRGSITVFISVILSALTAFSGIVVDLSRFRMGEKHARAAVQLSVQSALTQYFAPLKDNYGLWANGYNEEELEALIYDLTERNLSVENMFMPGVTDLFGFSVDNVSVYPMFNLADENVLEKEITHYMKYRAPVNTIGNFLDKLKALHTFMAQSGLLNKRMGLEDKLQKVREDQVYLNLLLAQRIPLFLNGDRPMKEINDNLRTMSLLLNEINSAEKPKQDFDRAWLSMPPLIEKIKEARSRINEVKKEISGLEQKMAPLERERNQIENSIDSFYEKIEDIEREISKLEDKISEENSKDEPDEKLIKSCKDKIYHLSYSISSLETKIFLLNDELEEIEKDIRDIERKISAKNGEIKSIKNSIKEEEQQLRSKIAICTGILEEIKQKGETVREKMAEIEETVDKFIKYHEESVKLIPDILKQGEEISRLTDDINSDIKNQSEKSDNAFLVKIKADMKKLEISISPEILNSIKSVLDQNLESLNKLYTATDSSIKKVSEILNDLQIFINKTRQLFETLGYFEREDFGTDLEKEFNNVNERINLTVSVYKLTSYELEPAANQKEKNEFKRWCNKVFKEKNETEDRDKGYEKTLRNNIKNADDKGKEENERFFNGKDRDLTDKELVELFKSLPSNNNNESDSILPGEEANAEPEEKYKKSLDTNGNIAKAIDNVLSLGGEALLKSLYVNEYIVCAFKNVNSDKVPTQRINLYGCPEKTFFEKAEVEYILFGKKEEKANANLAQVSIFGIRMGLNLIHVYMDPGKISTAYSAALSISGWTGFGVPIVKNLILFGWAAGESYLDLKDINNGKDVPVYKTVNTWRLSLESIFSGIAGRFLDDSSKWLKQTKDEWIDKADDAINALVRDMVSSAVHEAFLPLEQAITELGSETDTTDYIELTDLGILYEINDIEDLKNLVQEICQKQCQFVKGKTSGWSKNKLEDYKSNISNSIIDFIIDSPSYKKLFSSLKESLNNIVDVGATQLSESLKEIGSKIGDQGLQSQLVGTVVSFDYTDYLRLLLFAVPQKTKLLRAADLMQLNMRETLDNPDFLISEYNSFILVEADISMKAMFIPSFLRGNQSGRFKIRWGYGY
ncbi:MAG: hypothetical protein GX213_06925 [Clostridiaceae bacterium]|nr:hypothetical protein [Clostridiaceae bacterium]